MANKKRVNLCIIELNLKFEKLLKFHVLHAWNKPAYGKIVLMLLTNISDFCKEVYDSSYLPTLNQWEKKHHQVDKSFDIVGGLSLPQRWNISWLEVWTIVLFLFFQRNGIVDGFW